jgi:hypothetical protein
LLDNPPPREREAVEKLKALLTDDPADANRKRLRWEGLSERTGNVVVTFVRTTQ